MGDRWFDPLWWLRLRCKHIATLEQTALNETTVRLCRRWRWHGRECAA